MHFRGYRQKGESQTGGNKKTKRQIFQKTKIYYPMIRTRTFAYQGIKIFRFLENLGCFVFLLLSFWDSLFFALLLTICANGFLATSVICTWIQACYYFCYSNLQIYSFSFWKYWFLRWDVLRHFVSFVQIKKCEKCPWRSTA